MFVRISLIYVIYTDIEDKISNIFYLILQTTEGVVYLTEMQFSEKNKITRLKSKEGIFWSINIYSKQIKPTDT